MKLLLFLTLIGLWSLPAYSQYKINDSCSAFSLTIEGKNMLSDSIRILYNDCNGPQNSNELFVLQDGKGTIHGSVNRATEAILFANLKSKLMGGPSIIRFILEPGDWQVNFEMTRDTVLHAFMNGAIENQKDNWESTHSSLLELRENYRDKLIALVQKKQPTDSATKMDIQIAQDKFDVLSELLIKQILAYVTENQQSYFSAYLLDYYKRGIPADTMKEYFSSLPPNIIYCDFGKFILDELFKQTDDWEFRGKFANDSSFKKLKNSKTVYDVPLINSNGTETNLSAFKGKFLLIDFWAGWCTPCVRNAPYLQKLIKEMKNKPVKFISVSIDKDVQTWKKSIEKYKFPGFHLFDQDGLLSTFYKVLWVPRYIIVKPDGTVAELDAPQANDPELKSKLKASLAEVN